MSNNEATSALRLTLVAGVIVALFLALFGRLWFLQVLAGERFAALAESNRVQIVVLEPPRGRILAADGEELVKNRPAQTISAHKRELLNGLGEPRDEQAEKVLARLSQLLSIPVDEIVERMNSRKYSPHRPVPIAVDVPPELIFAVSEHQELFPGIEAETLPVRTYPHGTTAAHLVGYTGEISQEDLEQPQFADYRQGDLIGWAGLEKTYEPYLHGEEGMRKLEVNAKGIVQANLGGREPARGDDLWTSLDLDLQRATERILQEGIVASREIQRDDGRFLPSVAGSAVVLDARDSSVVAIASWPTYDPSEFVGGVSFDYWGWLQDPANQYPLIDRAIQSAYPPGSVFKTVTGAAALEAGIVGPSTPVSCPPSWELGNITFRNWNPRHEGSLDLAGALRRSCDTYFYELAAQQWVRETNQLNETGKVDEILPRVAHDFGFGRTLGIDLPSERSGQVPSRAWRTAYWAEHKDTYCAKAESLPPGYARDINADLCRDGGRWRGGDAVNSSIGQGDVLATPLQVAASYAAIANGGTLYAPRIGQRIVSSEGETVAEFSPEALGRLPVDEAGLAAIRAGLRDVVMHERGTGRLAFTLADFPLDSIPVAGKTGTAELKPKVPYAWFASYAPADDPRYVVVVSVEEGGGGSQTAAPIAARILQAAFGLDVAPFVAGPANVD
ncbi:MAG: penicillin-binding protein 2 [Actinobacteria bacterium]|nr:penicillin-binding protein 2 [Actinomycetota bacterium]